MIIPNKTGTVTTNAIFKATLAIEISDEIETPIIFAELITTNGTDNIQTKLVTAVSVTDKATSPFANLVKIIEVAPPGAAAIIINPTAIAVGKLSKKTRPKATIGSKISWEKNPTKKSFGFFTTLEKSVIVSPRPNPNMIIAKANGAIFVTISINYERYLCYFITECNYF